MVMIEERFSDYCDLCGAWAKAGFFAIYCEDHTEQVSEIHICPDCIEEISKLLDEMVVNTAKMGENIRDFLRGDRS